MVSMSIDQSLIKAIKQVLSKTTAEINGEVIETFIGVPQGAVLSPTLFNLYINDLIRELQMDGTPYAFADDVVQICQDRDQLVRSISIIETWCRKNFIDVNKDKNGIMIIRQDRRTPLTLFSQINGFPVVEHYKYLGVIIDDCLKLDHELEVKKEAESKLTRSLWVINSQKLTGDSRYHLWQALFKSKTWYYTIQLTKFSRKIHDWAESYLYRSILKILRIKGKPSKVALFSLLFDLTGAEVLNLEWNKFESRQFLKKPDCDYDMLKQILPSDRVVDETTAIITQKQVKLGWAFAKHIISVNIGPLMAWWLGIKFNGYTSSQNQRIQNAMRCSCGTNTITIKN